MLDSSPCLVETYESVTFNYFRVRIHRSELTVASLSKNSTNKSPSLPRKLLALILLAEVCTLNVFSLILPTLPI